MIAFIKPDCKKSIWVSIDGFYCVIRLEIGQFQACWLLRQVNFLFENQKSQFATLWKEKKRIFLKQITKIRSSSIFCFIWWTN